MAIGCFAAMGGTRVNEPSRMVFALDHNAPAPSRAATQLHQRMRELVAAPEPERQAIARPESEPSQTQFPATLRLRRDLIRPARRPGKDGRFA